MFDLTAEEFKQKIVDDINTSGLPSTAILYILQEVLRQVAAIVQQQIEEQRKQRNAATDAAEKE